MSEGFSFGEWVAVQRRRLKLSQQDLAKMAGVHYKTVSRVENDHQNITLATANKVAHALGYTVSVNVAQNITEKES